MVAARAAVGDWGATLGQISDILGAPCWGSRRLFPPGTPAVVLEGRELVEGRCFLLRCYRIPVTAHAGRLDLLDHFIEAACPPDRDTCGNDTAPDREHGYPPRWMFSVAASMTEAVEGETPRLGSPPGALARPGGPGRDWGNVPNRVSVGSAHFATCFPSVSAGRGDAIKGTPYLTLLDARARMPPDQETRPKDRTMGIAVYLRVSSKGQRHDSQESEIRRWLGSNGIDPDAVGWYRDKETGKRLDRPEFNRLRADIFDGRVRTVVCWKLDRLSRRLKDGIDVISDWCEKGVRIVSTTQQIDLGGAVGKMIAAVMLGLAEIELEYRAERQAAGIRDARRKGVYKGRRAGTTKARPGRARELRGKGLTAPEIAEAMGVSLRTVRRYIERPARA